MAIIIQHGTIDDMPRNATGTSTPENYAKCIYDLFSEFDSRFSYTEGNDYITVDNKFKIKFYKGGWDHLGFQILNINDTVIFSRSTSVGGNIGIATYNVDIIATNDLFYAFVYSSTGSDNGFVFFWHTKNDKNFVGLTLPDNGGPLSAGYIENSTIACVEDSSANFKFMTPTTYTLSSPKLLFSDIQAIYGDTGTYSVVDEFKSCSLVNFRSTVSTGGKNYYAIGKNTLIEAVRE